MPQTPQIPQSLEAETPESYALEYSQYSADKGLFPFHYGPLGDALRHNLIDFWTNQRGANKWQIIFIGSPADCQRVMDGLIARKKALNVADKSHA